MRLRQTPITIRLAKRRDASAIVDIFRAGFPKALLPYTIYAQDGIVDYLKGMIQIQRVGTTSATAVAERDGEVIAWAQFHRHPRLLFLNHIYVTPEFQGTGVGRQLLKDAVEEIRDPSQTYLGSEAFSSNSNALSWYAELGLEPTEEVDWIEMKPRPSEAEDIWWSFDGLITGLAALQRYGFCRIVLRTPHQPYVVRSLGTSIFRANGFDILDDPSALTGLHTLNRHRSLMCVATAPQSGTDYPIIATGQKVCGSMAEAIRRMT
jgi:ribosomal protein S18 acetylase RimI-like enzyme